MVCGLGRADIRLLVFVNAVAARQFADLPADATPEQVVQAPAVRARVAAGLSALRAGGGGSSSYAVAALLVTEPPGIDAGEITDKAYVNQRAVLTRRAALVRRLYDQPAEGTDIVTA